MDGAEQCVRPGPPPAGRPWMKRILSVMGGGIFLLCLLGQDFIIDDIFLQEEEYYSETDSLSTLENITRGILILKFQTALTCL